MMLDMLKELGSSALHKFEDEILHKGTEVEDPILKDNTDLVSKQPLPEYRPPRTEREAEPSPEADKLPSIDNVLKGIPGFALLNTLIRTFFPPGYGTYIWAVILLGASISSGFGHPIPVLHIPEDMSGMTGAVAVLFWFLRNAKT